jgi:hypothetical protein
MCKNLRRTGSRQKYSVKLWQLLNKAITIRPVPSGEKFSLAPKILAKFLERKTQLYEQVANVRSIVQYVRNWWRCVRARIEKRQVSIECLRLACQIMLGWTLKGAHMSWWSTHAIPPMNNPPTQYAFIRINTIHIMYERSGLAFPNILHYVLA